MLKIVRRIAGLCLIPPLVACTALRPVEDAPSDADAVQAEIAGTRWASESTAREDLGPWRHQPLPGKRATEFQPVRWQGREAVAAKADASASMLRKKVRVEPEALGRIGFSWMVPELIAQADLALREADDAPVRVVLAFEGDRSKWSARDTMLSEMARLLTGEEMPYATLMYVWCNRREPGSVVANPRTDRIRKLVVESGPAHLGRWLDYERDIRTDFKQAFGEEPGALVAVGIMSDSDNTRSRVRAWYGSVRLLPLSAAP